MLASTLVVMVIVVVMATAMTSLPGAADHVTSPALPVWAGCGELAPDFSNLRKTFLRSSQISPMFLVISRNLIGRAYHRQIHQTFAKIFVS